MAGGLLMSNKLNKIIAISLAFFGMCLAACNNTSGGGSQHTHTFSNQWSSDSTYHWHDSTCGHDVTSEKAAHTFNDVVTPATYDHGGYTTHTCSVCGYSYTDSETDQLVHHYSDAWSHNETHHWHACTDVGYEDLYEDMEGHSMSKSIISATDDEEGYTLHSCECGYSYKDNYTSAPNKFIYQLNSDETGYGVYGYNGEAKILSIPSTHNSLPVLAVGYKGFMNNTSVKTLVVPNSVTSIGVYAFSGCTSLESIVLSNNIDEIRDNTFQNCSSLKELTIPNSVTAISGGSLAGCSSLMSITLPFVGCGPSEAEASSSTLFGYIFGSNSYSGSTAISQLYGDSSSATYYIPDSLKNVTVTGGNILYGAFSYSKIEHIVLKSGVNSIDKRLVYHCETLITADFSETSLEVLYLDTFSECYSLESVQMPSHLMTIDNWVFNRCYKLSSIDIPGTVTSIGIKAFQCCNSLTAVTIPDSVISLGNYAFNECAALETVNLGNGLTSIGNYAFNLCTNLKTVNFGGSLESIGNNAFQSCTSLTTICLPNSISSIGNSAFAGCINLTSIEVDSENLYYSANNGVLYNKAQTSLIRVPAGYSGSYSIPETVTSVASDAFQNCTSLTSIVVPSSVTSLPNGVFASCTSLQSITLPYVGGSATSNQYLGYIFGASSYSQNSSNVPSSLKEVVVNNGCTSIASNAFYGCSSITEVVVSDGVVSIGSAAFCGCSSLVSLTIPFVGSSVSASSASASTLFGYIFGASSYTGGVSTKQYYASSSSKTYYIPSSLKNLTVNGGHILYGALGYLKIETLKIGAGVKSINQRSVYTCSNLKTLDMSEATIENFGSSAFAECSSLTNVMLPPTCKEVSQYIFRGCTSLSTITIPEGVAAIGNYTFQDCSSLSSITLPNTLTSIGYNSFEGCSLLSSVELPNGVEYIGSAAFRNCTSLTSISIPNSVTTLGNYAFEGCIKLSSATIGNGLSTIPEGTFYGCSKLVTVSISDGVTSIGDYAFQNCSHLTLIVIPSSVSSIGQSAFEGCSSLLSVYYRGSPTDLSIGSNNTRLLSVLYYYSASEPTDALYNYWHYVNGVPTLW